MDVKSYSFTDDSIDSCLQQIRSQKWALFVSPLVFLILNYCAVFSLFGSANSNHSRNILIFILLSLVTTIAFYFFGKSGINRYKNIVKRIEVIEAGPIKFVTISDRTFSVQQHEYKRENDTFIVDRNNRYPMYVLTIDGSKIYVIPSWFDDNQEIIATLI